MKMTTTVRSLLIGLATGMRSSSGTAALRWHAGDPLRLLYAVMCAGELIVDKLPMTPARSSPPALLFRLMAGGYAGRAVAGSHGGGRLGGTFAGVVGALAGTYGMMRLRAAIVENLDLPDPLVAVAEDALALTLAIRACT